MVSECGKEWSPGENHALLQELGAPEIGGTDLPDLLPSRKDEAPHRSPGSANGAGVGLA